MGNRPLDILKSALTARLWHKTPYLICTLELENDTSIGKYLFPTTAKLEIFGELIALAIPTLESPGSHRSGPWATTYETGGISMADFYWKAGTRRHLYCCFEIGAMVLNSLVSNFDNKENGPYRIDLELGTIEEQMIMVQRQPRGPMSQEEIPKPSEGILAYVEGMVKVHEW